MAQPSTAEVELAKAQHALGVIADVLEAHGAAIASLTNKVDRMSSRLDAFMEQTTTRLEERTAGAHGGSRADWDEIEALNADLAELRKKVVEVDDVKREVRMLKGRVRGLEGNPEPKDREPVVGLTREEYLAKRDKRKADGELQEASKRGRP